MTHTASHHTSAPSTHQTDVQVRGYLIVFGALLVLTMATVGASYLRLAVGPTIVVALSIAVVKGGLVAAVFMHLNHERALIYGALALTAVLAVALFSFTAWTEADHLPGARISSPYSAAPAALPAPAPASEAAH
jgi:caa(3)-type oxidase subunit IV